MNSEKWVFDILFLVFLFFGPCNSTSDTITPNQPIKDGELLVSNGKTFALGFFSPGNGTSSRRYVGIWYYKISEQTVVWVANQDNPINGKSGVISINQDGNLVIYDDDDNTHNVTWDTNISTAAATNSYYSARLLDSGNLVGDEEMNLSLEECEAKCLTWYGNLMNARTAHSARHSLYIRVDADQLLAQHLKKKSKSLHGKKMIIVVTSVVVMATLIISLVCWLVMKKARRVAGFDIHANDEENLELPIFDMITIAGGQLSMGKDIAVKRLSTSFKQGVDEFQNEVILIAKLQHRNLVRLLGCCIHGEERMLVYEYMASGSLDSFIFDVKNKSKSLTWRMCLDIIVGIARGVLYLHQDSRLRIIHRDLKASNVAFGEAWQLWTEGKAYELLDPLMEGSFPMSKVLRCIHVGLLCVQKNPEDRPPMSSVLLMLVSDSAMLPQPKRPGFYTERSSIETHDHPLVQGTSSINEVTVTCPNAR
ncbi:unnamed protein product [Camellia sinensis]